ncbi:MAG: hypothetical protein A3E57_09260 [Candidatus Muproteobacteria bacterium RIFCSPHIGHO2_12_FULL_60_33]|nr:MAG: hypothetical protein A3E57_09260 [Candidatus Muproteobacteria bacterium RIFCSPHIGHO2_12_FULL_60_33]OGI55672.1 MAG: hypothetical protein A3D32_05175 [Candidatus Muproteobacteria bacterium RIFCSPHIGHO2_02_FULL_60_13]
MADSQEKAGAMRRCWSALRKPSAKYTCRKTTIIAQPVACIRWMCQPTLAKPSDSTMPLGYLREIKQAG